MKQVLLQTRNKPDFFFEFHQLSLAGIWDQLHPIQSVIIFDPRGDLFTTKKPGTIPDSRTVINFEKYVLSFPEMSNISKLWT